MGSHLLFALRMRLTLALVLTTLAIVAEGNPKPMTVKANVAVKAKSDTPDTGVYGGRAQGSGCRAMKLAICSKKLVPKIKACDDRDTFYPCLLRIMAGRVGDCQDCMCLLIEKVTPQAFLPPCLPPCP